MAVNWCAALSSSTSLMTSSKVQGCFSYILAVIVGTYWKFLGTDVDCCNVIFKSTLLSCCYDVMDIGSKSFTVLLLYLHKAGSISMDIYIAEFQSKDALDFNPALSCLGGLVDEHVGEAA